MRNADNAYFVILNPAAGGGRSGKRAPAALNRLRASGLSLEVHETRGPGEARELAAKAWRAGHRRFLSVGGDGTGHEIINGLFPCEGEERPILGFLPLGTGNSFLRDFNIHKTESALEALERGNTHDCDVVRAEHRDGVLHYINLLSVGFTAEAGALTNARFKSLGPVGYVLATLATAARLKLPSYQIRADGGPWDGRCGVLLSFSNSRYTAGLMMMAPNANVADGKLDIIRIGAMNRPTFFRSFPDIFRGTHVDHPRVQESQAATVEFRLDQRVDVMVDGEVESLWLERLQVLPSALKIVA